MKTSSRVNDFCNDNAWDVSQALKSIQKFLRVVMHCWTGRIFNNIKQKVAFFDVFASWIQKIEENNLVKIVLKPCIISEEEVLDEEILDRVLTNLLCW